jgi:hypothetical protein
MEVTAYLCILSAFYPWKELLVAYWKGGWLASEPGSAGEEKCYKTSDSIRSSIKECWNMLMFMIPKVRVLSRDYQWLY